MNKAYRLLLTMCAAAATLSSCSSTHYAFNPATPAYLGSQPARTVAAAPVAAPAPVAAEVAAPATVTPVAVANQPEAKPATSVAVAPKKAEVAKQEVAAPVVPVAIASTTTKAEKPNFAQRLLIKKLNKQIAKAQVNKQSTAETAKLGTPLTVTLVGLIALVIGLIASSTLVIVLGAIVLAAGLLLYLMNM